MKTFKDTEGRSWDITATIGSLRRVKDLAEVDLTDPKRLAELGEDPFLLGGVLFALCKPQIEQRGLTEEQFIAGFDGDVVEQAVQALVGELILFSRPAKRATLRRVMEKKAALEQKMIDAAEEMIQDGGWIDQAAESKLLEVRKMMAASGPTSTDSPASSASTPPV